MKIETNSPPASLIKPSTSGTTDVKKTVSPDPKVSGVEANPKPVARDKMIQWFTRAGIFPTTGLAMDQDTNKKVSRHQYVKAQRKLKNLENVLSLAMNYSLEHSSRDDLDPDWFFSFIDMAEDINAPAMQELWGKIFAVEIGQPGTFSLKTLQTLKNLTHKDAKILKIAVSLASRKRDEHGLRVLFGYNVKPSILSLFRLPPNHQLNLASYGLTYPDLLSLIDLGLIYNSEIETSELSINTRSQYRCSGEALHIAPKRRGLSLQYYKFTSIGAELSKLIHGKSKTSYLDDLKKMLSTDFEVN
ncbi:TIGR03899 family protein [Aliiglaciecola sp. LCG003]|uniref:TIGR03899 family protein n=1 Tax=Aliiglaciecola sp. LCG003 TaxID=3053655 RepID=UPI002573F83D|nr:TIGR03899 family protein [Aliiglaciecola sp. LCG003]WJG09929.1 TIGR03899 family protein [Aliiglaciecola sp. LCG003]